MSLARPQRAPPVKALQPSVGLAYALPTTERRCVKQTATTAQQIAGTLGLLQLPELNADTSATETSASRCLGLRPVFDDEVSETVEVSNVRCHEDQVVDARDRGDLSVNVGLGLAEALLASSLDTVPVRGLRIIRQDRKGPANHVLQVRLQFLFPLPSGKARAAVGQLVPHDRRDRALLLPSGEHPDRGMTWFCCDRRR